MWKDIPGYDGLYQASDEGQIRSLNRKSVHGKTLHGKILKPFEDRCGYYRVKLWKDGKSKHCLVHRAVLLAFSENQENKPFVNHLDENPKNNNLSNLEWATAKENANYGTKIERVINSAGWKTMVRKKERGIIQFNKSGDIIRRWSSLRSAARALAVNHWDISKCCRGKKKSCYGFIWRYADNAGGGHDAGGKEWA